MLAGSDIVTAAHSLLLVSKTEKFHDFLLGRSTGIGKATRILHTVHARKAIISVENRSQDKGQHLIVRGFSMPLVLEIRLRKPEQSLPS